MRLGTMTTLFRDQRETDAHTPYLESLRFCRDAGFTVLDFNLCALPRRKTELHGEDWKTRVDAIRNEAEKLGIVFSQSHPPYRPGREGVFQNPEEGAFFQAMALRAIEISAMLGVKWAVLHPVTAVGSQEYVLEENIAYNHQVFGPEAELAFKLNVGLAFENMCDSQGRRRFGTTAGELTSLMDSFRHPLVGLCWDTGHANRQYDDQVPAILQLGRRIKALHIDDNIGQTDLHLMPFLGNIPWERVMHALYETGYEGDLIYEIKSNDRMPAPLKDRTASYVFAVGEYLLSLFK